MHLKDFYLALILGLAIAHTTYEWTSALGMRFSVAGTAGRAWADLQSEISTKPQRPALRPHAPYFPPYRDDRR